MCTVVGAFRRRAPSAEHSADVLVQVYKLHRQGMDVSSDELRLLQNKTGDKSMAQQEAILLAMLDIKSMKWIHLRGYGQFRATKIAKLMSS